MCMCGFIIIKANQCLVGLGFFGSYMELHRYILYTCHVVIMYRCGGAEKKKRKKKRERSKDMMHMST